jgi:AraC family transcriptional regulator of adaptative response/methylated-DNA-[protein]-cysteine methyltransferase
MERGLQARQFSTVAQAIDFVRIHSTRQPTLEQIAAAVHMSPFHLQKVFSEWAGLSPKRFLQYLTKEHAKACLLQSQTVLEASDAVGLSSAGRLHDLMVTAEAMTPGEIQSGGAGVAIGFGAGDSPFGEVFLAWTPRGICQLALWKRTSHSFRRNWLPTGLLPNACKTTRKRVGGLTRFFRPCQAGGASIWCCGAPTFRSRSGKH